MPSTTKVAAAAAIAVVTLASSAGAQTPPDIDIPRLPGSDVERFKVTLNGSQGSTYTFALDVNDGGCAVHAEGRLTEDWRFARGKGVVVEFRRIAGTRTVFLQRRGHPPGDVSFATPGTVTRTASGFWNEMGPPPCQGHRDFSVADCGVKLRAKADARFIWNRGKLTIEPTSRSLQRPNPARECGGGADNIAGALSWEYPFLAKQKGKLTAKQVFGRRKHLVVPMSAGKPLMPFRDGMYVRQEEQFGGDTRLVLSRLK